MPIYDIFDTKPPGRPPIETPPLSKKDRFISSLTARLLFFVLLLGDLLWGAYALAMFALAGGLHLLTLGTVRFFTQVALKQWLSIKRSAICAVALFLSLFSPALGIMVACTYFLMYDKSGIQEVVPSSLQEQFQEFIR